MQDQPGGGPPEGGQPQQPEQQPTSPPPAPQGQPPAGPVQPEGQRLRLQDDPTKVWLLCIFTCGIYYAIWYHRMCKEIGEWSQGQIETDPGTSVLAVTLGACVLVPPYMSWAGTLGRIRQMQQMVGLPPKAEFWPWFGYTLLAGYGYYWIQEQLNEIAERAPQPAT